MTGSFTARPMLMQLESSSCWLKSARSSAPLPSNRLVRNCQQLIRNLEDAVAGRTPMNSRDFYLPLRPISKARPRSFRGQARPYTDTVYKEWLTTARTLLEEWWIHPPLSHVSLMDVEFYGPARGDLDNRLGSVLDAMVQAKVVTDDNVNVIPRIRMSFTKTRPADAQIYIKLTWGEK